MYRTERQNVMRMSEPSGPFFEQWYLLHHRLVRIVTNHADLAQEVRSYLYYAELLAENTYQHRSQLSTAIPEYLFWLAGSKLHRPIALTCSLLDMGSDNFSSHLIEAKPADIPWSEISGVEGPLRARWKRGPLRFREYQAFPGVTSRIISILDRESLQATIYIASVRQCSAWFLMRFVFYMVVGAMFIYDGYEALHAGAIAYDGVGTLLIGPPGSGKSTLVLSCLQEGMLHLADDVLFLGQDNDIIHAYAFPEDIGIREGAHSLLGRHSFMSQLTTDEREKRFVNIRRYFQRQVISSTPLSLLLFLNVKNRANHFRADSLSPGHAISLLMSEYLSKQGLQTPPHLRSQTQSQVQYRDIEYKLDFFAKLVAQCSSYSLCLSPDTQENALRVQALVKKMERLRQEE